MRISAEEVVQSIGNGVANARKAKQFFLGVDGGDLTNADIHPEYVTTVEVGRAFCDPSRRVSLEMHMKDLREGAIQLARYRAPFPKSKFSLPDKFVERHKFGKVDSQHFDIFVQSDNTLEAPLLIAEAKLGVKDFKGISNDICRIVRLLAMYDELGITDHIYGAALFHLMEEETGGGALAQRAQELVLELEAFLISVKQLRPWLKSKVGLLTHGADLQQATGYRETYPDGFEEDIFQKVGFTFKPGLVLLGRAQDVEDVDF